MIKKESSLKNKQANNCAASTVYEGNIFAYSGWITMILKTV